MDEEQGLNFQKLVEIGTRRMWWIIVPAVIVPLMAIAVSYKITPRYQSQAFVLVEEPKVPDKFVAPVITNQLDVRLMTLKEQILSRSRLEPIITSLSLYSNKRRLSMEDKVDLLRAAIDVRVIKPDGSNRVPSGFYIVAQANNPSTAQSVCTQILSMFMDENLKVRQQQAAGTTAFLSDELEQAKRKLDTQDARLADFKRHYFGQLPSDEQRNLEMLNSTRTRLEAVIQELSTAQQQKIVQESLLSQQLKARTATTESGAAPVDLQKQLALMQDQLAALSARYTAEHPDVIKLKAQIANLKQQLANAPPPSAESNNDAALDTPEVRQARTAVRLAEENIRAKRAEQARLSQEVSVLQGRLQLSPAVEEQYKALTRDYETAQKFYDDLLSKKAQSEMATNLEKRQEGEQFRLVDAPDLPLKPEFPNRVKFGGAGLAAGLFLGLGLAWTRERSQNYLRTEEDVIHELDVPVLIALPDVSKESARSTYGSGHRTLKYRRNKVEV
jgi:polysaccharide chain length determinant protein (PEP-CTERM system associated)